MIPPEVDPNVVERAVRDLWERVRVHQGLLGDDLMPLWEDLSEVRRIVLRRAMGETMVELFSGRYSRSGSLVFRPRGEVFWDRGRGS